ncbi:hypothetical protein GCM10010182_74730 [Actinomadura cremea]|nr:hypothetical protein GCM10010182_74730 [Actinomadura cremea]
MDLHMDAHHMRGPVAEGATGLLHPEVTHFHRRPRVDSNARAQCPARRARSVQTVTEKWRFHCLCCLHAWEDLYEVRHCGHAIAWQLSGMPAQPPWADPICRECHSLRVKALSVGLMAHNGPA